MYEHRSAPLLPRRQFLWRMGTHALVAGAMIGISLTAGMIGYHSLAQFSWLDSFVNAAMLLGGMGPVGEIHSSAGKVFAGLYALYAGLVLLLASAVLLTPVVHRLLHILHLEGGGARR